MQLRRLSTADMIALSQRYLDPFHPAHQALASVPELASLLAGLSEAHEVLLRHQPPDNVQASSIQDEIVQLDAERDDLMYGIRCLFRSLVLLAEDDIRRAHWERLREALLSGERETPHLSYQVEAANAVLLQHVLHGLSPADKQSLEDQFLGRRSMFEIIERWITVGKELGKKEIESRLLSVPLSDTAFHEARSQWVWAVGTIVSLLETGDLPASTKQPILVPLRIVMKGKPKADATAPSGGERVAKGES